MDEKPRMFCAGLPLVEERPLTDGEWSEMQSRRRRDAQAAQWLPHYAALLAVLAIVVCFAANRFVGDPTLPVLAVTAVPFFLVLRASLYRERLKRYPADRREVSLRRFAGTVAPEYRGLLRILRLGRRSKQRSLTAEVGTLHPSGTLWSVDGFTAASLWSKSFWSEVEQGSEASLTESEVQQIRARIRKSRLAWSIGDAGEALCVGIDLFFLAMFAWLFLSASKVPQTDHIRAIQAELVWQIVGGIIALPVLCGFWAFARRKRRTWGDLARELRNPRLVVVDGVAGRHGRPARIEMFEHSGIPWTIDGVPAPWRFGESWTPTRVTVLGPAVAPGQSIREPDRNPDGDPVEVTSR